MCVGEQSKSYRRFKAPNRKRGNGRTSAGDPAPFRSLERTRPRQSFSRVFLSAKACAEPVCPSHKNHPTAKTPDDFFPRRPLKRSGI